MPLVERYPRVPLSWPGSLKEHLLKIAQAVNGLLVGQTNNTQEITLDASATETEVTENAAHPNVTPILVPKTANAAAATGIWFEAFQGRVVIHHDSSPATDRTFSLLLFG